MTNITNSANTKNAIERKFKELVSQRPLSKVTVSEIIKECNINRKTFYYYFEDIYALLIESLHREAINIVAKFDFQNKIDNVLVFIFEYIEENISFLKNIYHSVARDELKRLFYSDFSEIVANMLEIKARKNNAVDPDFKKFTVKFYTEAFASTFIDYIADYPNVNKVKTARWLSEIINNSIF